MNNQKNTEAIINLSKEKSLKTKRKVERCISEMAVNNETINFNSVSIRAGVSKSWLYKNKDIRTRIEGIRNQQVKLVLYPKKKSPNSEDVLIRTLKERIKALQAENTDLKRQLEKLYAKLI